MTSVSYLVTAYNAEGTLPRALRSLCTEAGALGEVVVVDDGSADATLDVARSFADRLPLSINCAGRVGRAEALNLGMNKASSPIVAILDADDAVIEGRTDQHRHAFDADGSLAMHGGAFIQLTYEPERVVRRREMPIADADIRRRLAYSGPFCHSTVAYQRDAVIDAGGFRSGLKSRIDQDLWVRLGRAGATYRNADTALGIHYKGADTFYARVNSPWQRTASLYRRNVDAVRYLRLPYRYYLVATVRAAASLAPLGFFQRFAPGVSDDLDLSVLSPAERRAVELYATAPGDADSWHV